MSTVPQNRIRLLVLSGFLGSGKTSWLRHQLHEGRLRERAVIVNEAAAAPVDDALLADLARVTVIPGGCVCCSVRQEFLRVLRDHCNASRPQDIVLETSGLAEPAAIVEAIRNDPVLVHRILIDEVMVTVDAVSALDRLKSDVLIRAQTETADALVITKLDLLGPDEAGKLAATLKVLNPGARIMGAVKGETVPLPQFADIAPQELPRIGELPQAKPVIAVDIDIDPAIWAGKSSRCGFQHFFMHAATKSCALRAWFARRMAECCCNAFRSRFCRRRSCPRAPAADRSFDNRLAFIGRGFDREGLQRSLKVFCG